MKYFSLLIILFSLGAYSQVPDGPLVKKELKKVECHRKPDSLIFDKRYGEWECGRSPAIVDCNEFLELDQEMNVYFHKKTGKPFSGDCETCHLTGRRELLIHFKNGREDGIDTSYYPSGCIMAVRNNIIGERDGTWKYFYDSTYQEYFIENYISGVKHGVQKYYHKNGNMKKLETFKMNSLDGKKLEYYYSPEFLDSSSLKVKKEIDYKAGQYHGKYLMFSPQGKPMIEENYVSDRKDGEQKYYQRNGNLMRTEEWSKGLREGATTTFFMDGITIIKQENYKKGQLNGQFKEWYFPKKDEEPLLKAEAIYKNGALLEQHVYDEFGKEIELDENDLNNKDQDAKDDGKKKKKKKK
jgi:antitoxin component YwqK of YwqJK toxin-antitoxin module